MPPTREGSKQAGMHFTGPLAGVFNSVLQKFGVKTAERKAPGALKQGGPNGADRRVQTQGVPLHIQLWLGARLPFVAFVLILGFFTYMYHISPIVPWITVFIALDFAVIVCWPPKMIGTKRRSFWDWGPIYSWMFAVGAAILFGLLNYGIIESWINTAFLREYKDVKPNTNPVAVSDAGVLTFEKGTVLDTSSAAGYKFWFYKYCAAPIVGPDPQAFPVTFWAVGVGCCGSRGDFTCDSAADKSTQSGMPLRIHNLGPEITRNYNHAIRMSAAANDLEVAKETVFVMWQKDPKAMGKWTWWISTTIFLTLTLVALCACCACQSGLMHISVMQQQ